jgi:hydrogenase nickel incorporation protein HypA/HybF
MHEYSLVQSLINRVEREARARDASGVHRVTVRIGPMGGVEPALFAAAFAMSRIGTICEHAELELKSEDVRWICEMCGGTVPAGRALVCPCCGWPARLAGGDALILERVELEVASHV